MLADVVTADVPAGATPATSTVPAPTGATAVMVVGELTLKLDEALEPKSTAVAPVKSVPVISMVAPPPAVPLDGLRALIDTGSATVPPPPESGPSGVLAGGDGGAGAQATAAEGSGAST